MGTRLKHLLWLVGFLWMMGGAVLAGTFELNTTRGLWQFDNTLNPTHTANHAPLQAVGFMIGVSPNSRFASDSGNYLIINSSTPGYGGLKNSEVFEVNGGFTPNGPVGAAYTNEWTIVMDVRFPTFPNYIAILQDRNDNSDDAEIFVNNSRQLQMFGATLPGVNSPVVSNPLNANIWTRLAFTSTYDSGTNRVVLRVYVDGVITPQTAGGAVTSIPENRYSLFQQLALFSDNSNAQETAIVHLGSLAVWSRPLSTDDISNRLGGYSTTGITWSGITPASGTPPLPALTGNLYFGDFLTRYTPPTGAALLDLANSAQSSANPNYVCEVTLPLSTNGGTVTGFPNHRYGGDLNVGILPNGDAVSLSTTNLIYLPPGGGPAADLGSASAVTYVRGGMQLTPNGLITRSIKLYFPAGMSVGISTTDRRTYDYAILNTVPLNQNLEPKTDPQLVRSSFVNDSNPAIIYPCTERIPVRFATSTITWSIATGRFTFSSGEAFYHQFPQLTRIVNSPADTRNRALPYTNDLYFRAAKNVPGSVVLGVRSGGICTVETAAISLPSAKGLSGSLQAFTHYPIMPIAWVGTGNIFYANNAITGSSELPGAKTTIVLYRRNFPVADCSGVAGSGDENYSGCYFVPSGRTWRFTADGGMRAQGIIGSGYDPATDFPTGTFSPSWVGYLENGTNFYGQQITTGLDSGRVMCAGQAVVGSEIQALALQERAYGMLYAGHSSPTNSALVERPATTAYDTGAADYPGLNLRATPTTLNAASRIAGSLTASYPLASTAKYYLRNSGVSGLHSSASGNPISLAAYGGAVFNLSALQLTYLDGLNKNSGVTGNVTVPTPNSTSFSLSMKRVLLGPQGQIAEAKLLSPQPNITLSYWNFTFTPQAVDFPQPKGCPPPSPSEGFVRLAATAALPALVAANQTVTGDLGFYAGDLVTEDSPVVNGLKRVSRFEPGSLLSVPGPGGKNWNVAPTGGIYLNQKAVSNPDPASLNAGGLLDVPFFNDMEVHLRAPSTAVNGNPLIYVRKAVSPSGSSVYDSAHRGRDAAAANLADYLTNSAYDARAIRKWQDLVSFDLPVAFQAGTNTFRTITPKTDEVLLFTLNQAVKTMTPDNAELVFDGQANVGLGVFLKQINFAALLGGATIPGVGNLITPATNAVKSLDNITNDQLRDLVQPVLAASATLRANATFYNTLSVSANRAGVIDNLLGSLTNDVQSIFGTGNSGINGQALRGITAQLDTAINGMNTARGLVESAATFKNLADGIGSILNGGSSAPVEPSRLEELKVTFQRASADLTIARDAIGVPLNTAITASSGGVPFIQSEISLALKDLREKWAPADPAKATALYSSNNASTFASDLAQALADRVGGSTFAGQANAIIRQQLADAQFLTRQVLDDTLAQASSLLPLPESGSLPVLGPVLSQKLASASLKGYAHLKGDTLEELRLDGKATLNVGDEMEFNASFLLKSVDSSTPAGACLAAGGAKAEVTIAASTNLAWTGQNVDISLAGRVAFDATSSPTGFFGDMKLVGELDFSSIKITELALGFGFGINSSEAQPGNQNQYYLYGKAAGKTVTMDVAAGIFLGRTCSLDPIKNADPDIGRVVSSQNLQPPYTGAAAYAFGAISLMPIIGIPPSCLLDLRVGGGQGFFAFYSGPSGEGALVAGFKTTQSVSGDLLCLASVTGQQDTVIAGVGEIKGGSPRLISLSGDSRFTASGKVGVGFLSYTFKKSVGVIINANPNITWSIDY